MNSNIDCCIPKIKEGTNYWIVRSGVEGKYFNQFYYDNCIALGWDKINNINLIKELKSVETLKNIVKKEYSDELNEINNLKKSNINRKVGDIANKIYKFINELKVGDIIVTPGKDEILIGEVTSDAFLVCNKYNKLSIDKESERIGELNKARSVKWLKRINRDELEPNLRLILRVYHGIAHINNEQVITEINRTIYNFYITNNEGHTIYRINSQESIDFSKYANFINHINGIYELIKDDFKDEKMTIKTNVQSPGPIELIGNSGLVKVILAAANSLFKNNDEGLEELDPRQRKKIKEYKQKNPNTHDYDDYEFPSFGTY